MFLGYVFTKATSFPLESEVMELPRNTLVEYSTFINLIKNAYEWISESPIV